MKRFIFAFAIGIWLLRVATLSANETISETMTKLRSLSGDDLILYYQGLSEETKKAIAEYRGKEFVHAQKKFAAFEKRKMELQLQGTEHFISMFYSYQSAMTKVLDQIEDPEIKEAEKERMWNKNVEFGQTVYAAPAPLMIGLWKKYKDRAESEWEAYWKIAPDATGLHKIQTGLMESILRDTRKIIEAEPEQDKLWYTREKWQPFLEETPPGKDHPAEKP